MEVCLPCRFRGLVLGLLNRCRMGASHSGGSVGNRGEQADDVAEALNRKSTISPRRFPRWQGCKKICTASHNAIRAVSSGRQLGSGQSCHHCVQASSGAKSPAISSNCSRAERRSSSISSAMTSGGGRVAESSMLSSRSQKMSRLALSRFTRSS